jgi:hypothetical protein
MNWSTRITDVQVHTTYFINITLNSFKNTKTDMQFCGRNIYTILRQNNTMDSGKKGKLPQTHVQFIHIQDMMRKQSQ